MNKLIIDNRTDLDDLVALKLVMRVVEMGRISNDNKQYCYLCIIEHEEKKYAVSTDLNKKSDRFVIMKNRK